MTDFWAIWLSIHRKWSCRFVIVLLRITYINDNWTVHIWIVCGVADIYHETSKIKQLVVFVVSSKIYFFKKR